MTARNYDVIITVDNATPFETTNVLIGNTSLATGVIANVNSTTNELKVKLSNSILEFSNLEVVHSNAISITGSANGLLNTTSLPFQSNTYSGNSTTAIATIQSIGPSGFIAEKNAFTQNPVGCKKPQYRSATLLVKDIGLINLSAKKPIPMKSIYMVSSFYALW